MPRPVTIIDAGWRRDLDLQVIWPRKLDRPGIAGSIWPEIESELLSLVQAHRSTIIFANNRRTVEKLTARLNELAERRRRSARVSRPRRETRPKASLAKPRP